MKQKSQAFSDVVTGVFMLAVLALLAYFTIIISGVDLVRGKERVQTVFSFDRVGGLKDHDAVVYRGAKVGTVEKIELTDGGVDVKLDIDKAVRLRTGCRAVVCSMSILGGNYLLLEEGEGEPIEDLGADGLKLHGESPTDWMRDLAKITKNLNELTSSEELRASLTNLNAVIASVRTAVGNVERSLGDTKGTMASVKRTFDNAAEITDRLKDDKVLEDLKEGIAAFRKSCESFDFTETKGDIRAAIAETKGEFKTTLGDVKDEFRSSLGEVKNAFGDFRGASGDVREVMAAAKQLLASLNEVADRVRNGDSTVGKLMSEPDMYNEVEGLIKDCRQIIDNYRDTTPISSFSSLATGAL